MDSTTLNRQTDLAALVPNLRRRGQYHIGPCPFCGGVDRFTIKRVADGDLWICRRCGDGHYHDAVAFLMRRDNLTFSELMARQEGPARPPAAVPSRPRPGAPPAGATEPPDEEWQIDMLAGIRDSIFFLNYDHDEAACAARRYLDVARGLRKEVREGASLGFNPAWKEIAPGCRLAPGIVIPGMMDGQLWYVKVRTTQAARDAAQARGKPLGKYTAVAGSRLKALYNADHIYEAACDAPVERAGEQGGEGAGEKRGTVGGGRRRGDHRRATVVVVEGEFDALLLSQYLPAGWAAVTMGSAMSVPDATWLRFFAPAGRILLRLDEDDAGRAGLAAWRRVLSNVHPLPPLPGGAKDVTDFRRAGGDIRAWLEMPGDVKS